ncbi:FAD:protein FMN transferase [Shewanella sairae]|nr:FAD:protein FMN transferase [Shewanella sairae]MCL1132258.1 FAD:protein FMN transferase [Shewanella sairae]
MHKFLYLLLCLFVPQVWGMTQNIHFSGETMGTTYSVQLDLTNIDVTAEELKRRVELELDKVNQSLSVFNEDSEITRVNRSTSKEPITLSNRLYDVLEISKQVSLQTDGALDITLGPVIEFWGFGVKPRELKQKDRGQLELARSKTGMDGFALGADKLEKIIPSLTINPSAVAKGYGVDRVANVLSEAGVNRYLVEIGGEIVTKGETAEGKSWKVAITRPEKLSLQFQQVVGLNNMAIATSGSYVNYIETAGQTLSHIIDPETGMPIKNTVVSTTVLHPQCAVADGFATAFMVLNLNRSIEIANQLGLAVMLIEKTEQGFKAHFSHAIYPYLLNHSGTQNGV